jgi:hypothetical protein
VLFCGRNKVTRYAAANEGPGSYTDIDGRISEFPDNLLLYFQRDTRNEIYDHADWKDMMASAVPEMNNWLRPHYAVPWGRRTHNLDMSGFLHFRKDKKRKERANWRDPPGRDAPEQEPMPPRRRPDKVDLDEDPGVKPELCKYFIGRGCRNATRYQFVRAGSLDQEDRRGSAYPVKVWEDTIGFVFRENQGPNGKWYFIQPENRARLGITQTWNQIQDEESRQGGDRGRTRERERGKGDSGKSSAAERARV